MGTEKPAPPVRDPWKISPLASGPEILAHAPVTYRGLPAFLRALSPRQRKAVWVAALIERIEEHGYKERSVERVLKAALPERSRHTPAAVIAVTRGKSLGFCCFAFAAARDGKPFPNPATKTANWGVAPHHPRAAGKRPIMPNSRYKVAQEPVPC